MLKLDEILDTVLDGRTKGVPPAAAPFVLRDIAGQGWNVLQQDLPLPLMVLKRPQLDHNAQVFADYLQRTGVSLAPHGKTTMAPQIFAEQLSGGAWGMTAATANQVAVMAHFGVKRVILANQLIGPGNIAGIVAAINATSDFSFYGFIDSAAQLAQLLTRLEGVSLNAPMRLLIELGVPGGRTGMRSDADALALIEAITQADGAKVRFAGLACFEGVVPGLENGTGPIADFAERVARLAEAVPPQAYAGLDEFILSGGGSSYFDIIADAFTRATLPVPYRVVLRSGCYVTHDHGGYDAAQRVAMADPHRHWSGELVPALEAWAYVQSLPEPGLALLTMGKRDIPYDSGLPRPMRRFRPGTGWLEVGEAAVFATNDQHAYVRLGAGTEDWQVGDMIASGISHPCTAFDKWRFIPVVDADYTVIDGVLTFF